MQDSFVVGGFDVSPSPRTSPGDGRVQASCYWSYEDRWAAPVQCFCRGSQGIPCTWSILLTPLSPRAGPTTGMSHGRVITAEQSTSRIHNVLQPENKEGILFRASWYTRDQKIIFILRSMEIRKDKSAQAKMKFKVLNSLIPF